MLTSSLQSPSNTTSPPLYGKAILGCVGCSGGGGYLAGAAQVQDLQQALVEYARALGAEKQVNPYKVDGVMNEFTALSAVYVVWKASDDIPYARDVKKAINALPLAGKLVSIAMESMTARVTLFGAFRTQFPTEAAQFLGFIEQNAATIAAITRAVVMTAGGLPLPGSSSTASSLLNVGKGLFNRGISPSSYPPGSVQTFSKKHNMWLTARPLNGLFGLGATPATHVFVAQANTPVPGLPEINNSEFDRITGNTPGARAWYGTTAGKIGIGAGVAAVATGVYYFWLRK